MRPRLDTVAPGVLRSLASAVRTGQLRPPFTDFAIRRVADCDGPTVALLQELAAGIAEPTMLAEVLDLAAGAAEGARLAMRSAQLVWTGPENAVAQSRDTAIVVQELLRAARRSVLVSGFVVYDGRAVFAELASNMDARLDLDVRLFLNVGRPAGDQRPAAAIVGEFAARFREREWPGQRLPSLYYDPRALAAPPVERAVLHAKCIVVDDERALVTSANLTDAAQFRNIEAGVLVGDPVFAKSLRGQFDALVESGQLLRIPGLTSVS